MYNHINFDINHFADLSKFIEHKYHKGQKMVIEAELNDLIPIECRTFTQEIIETMDSILFFKKETIHREYLWKLEPGRDNCYNNVKITIYAQRFDRELAESVIAESDSVTCSGIYLTGFKVNLPEKVKPQLNHWNNCGRISDAGLFTR